MKKTLVKALAMSAIAIALVVASVLGTMAYFTASSAVSNVFTVGDVAISMFETKVDHNGKPIETGTKTADTNSYKLVAGKTYTKDPTIYVNAGSEQSYLFLKVRNDLLTIEDGYNAAATGDEVMFGASTMRAQLEKNGWKFHHENTTTKVRVYVLCHTKESSIAEAGDESLVGQPRLVGKAYQEVINTFNTFTVDTDATQEQLKIYAGARVDLVAYAIQAEGFTSEAGVTDITKPGSAVTKAWNAIVATYPYESGVTG